MGKYMRKSKITGDIAVMEVSPQSSQGVRTRAAKTLALQRLHKSSSLSAFSSSPKASSSSYLQLRSRRLEKPPLPRQLQKAQHSSECCRGSSSLDYSRTNSRLKHDSADSVSVGSAPLDIEEEPEKQSLGVEAENGSVTDVKASFCQNYLESGVETRRTAENIPSSLLSESGTTETSDSTRKELSSHMTDSSVEMELCRSIPTSNDIEEFFAREELWHQRMFIEKYNFDFANELPLQGRYEWMQMVP